MAGSKQMTAGFTLLETLIAVVLLAFLTLGLAAALRLGLRFPALSASAAQGEPVAAVQHFLRRELSAAVSLPSSEWNGVAFAGGPHALEAVALMPARAGLPGLDEVTLFLQGKQMMLRWRRLDPAAAPIEKALLSDVVALDFAYWGSADGHEPAHWHDEWRKPQVLPLLVRIRARLSGSSGDWPELVVALPTRSDLRSP